jgi:hypothetical protein
MNEAVPEQASAARIWKATGAALVVASLILVTVIWPIEFGIGPLSSGGRTDPDHALDEPDVSTELDEIMAGDPSAAPVGAQKSHAGPFKSDTVEIAMAAFEEVEFKARMNKGDALLYSWQSPEPVYVDMHGEPLTYPDDSAVRYEALDGVQSGHGQVTAPFSGMHGWYWLNTSDKDIVIELKVSGYYDRLEEVYRGSQ